MMRREAQHRRRASRPTRPRPRCCTRSTTASGSCSCSKKSTGRLPADAVGSRRARPRASTRRTALGELVAARAAADSVADAVRRDVHRLAHARGRGPRRGRPIRWCRERLDELAAAEARWEAVTAGDRADPRRRAQRQRVAHRRRTRRVRRLDEHVHRRELVRGARDAARRSSSKAAASPSRCSRAPGSTSSTPTTMRAARRGDRPATSRSVAGCRIRRGCRPCARSSARRARSRTRGCAGCGTAR